MTTADRIKKMAIAVFLGRGIMAVRQILMVPLMIRLWGAEYYGEWLVLSAIPSFLAMSNLGLGTAASIEIAMDVAAGKSSRAWSTFVTTGGLVLGIVLGTLLAFIAVVIGWPLRFDNFSHLNAAGLTLMVLGATTLIKLISPSLGGWWVGTGKASRANHWGNLNAVVELCLCVAVLWFSGGALELAVALLVWNIIWLATYASATAAAIRGLAIDPWRIEPDWGNARKLLTTGVGHQLSPLWQALLFQGSILLAAQLLGPHGAAMWGAMRIMVRSGCQVIELVSQSLGPEFQIAYGNADWEKLRKLHSMGLVASLGIAGGGVALLATIGPALFNVWTAHQFDVPAQAFGLMLLSLLPFSMWWVGGEVQRSINSPWYLNTAAVGVACLALLVMSSANWIGITGLCLGAFAFDLVMAVVVLKRTCKVLGDKQISSIYRGIFSASRLVTSR